MPLVDVEDGLGSVSDLLWRELPLLTVEIHLDLSPQSHSLLQLVALVPQLNDGLFVLRLFVSQI